LACSNFRVNGSNNFMNSLYSLSWVFT
jgi:hypothetical protein